MRSEQRWLMQRKPPRIEVLERRGRMRSGAPGAGAARLVLALLPDEGDGRRGALRDGGLHGRPALRAGPPLGALSRSRCNVECWKFS